MTSAPFPWQQSQWNYLIDRWRKNNLPHALLFCGIQGIGKRSLALAFTKTLFCTESLTHGKACDQCRSCHLFTVGSYPDFYLIEPEEEGKTIRIDQIRDLTVQLNQTTTFGSYKVVLITPAEALPMAAANALLKTLEEPSAGTIFILLANQANTLAATIRSRCQRVNFQPASLAMTKQWINNNLPEGVDSELLASITECAPLRALTLHEGEDFTNRKKFLQQLVELCERTVDPVYIAATWSKFSLSKVLEWFTTITMDAIRLKLSLASITNRDSVENLQKITKGVSAERFFIYLDEVYKARRQIHSSNPNQQLLLENLFCTWFNIADK